MIRNTRAKKSFCTAQTCNLTIHKNERLPEAKHEGRIQDETRLLECPHLDVVLSPAFQALEHSHRLWV